MYVFTNSSNRVCSFHYKTLKGVRLLEMIGKHKRKQGKIGTFVSFYTLTYRF